MGGGGVCTLLRKNARIVKKGESVEREKWERPCDTCCDQTCLVNNRAVMEKALAKRGVPLERVKQSDIGQIHSILEGIETIIQKDLIKFDIEIMRQGKPQFSLLVDLAIKELGKPPEDFGTSEAELQFYKEQAVQAGYELAEVQE